MRVFEALNNNFDFMRVFEALNNNFAEFSLKEN